MCHSHPPKAAQFGFYIQWGHVTHWDSALEDELFLRVDWSGLWAVKASCSPSQNGTFLAHATVINENYKWERERRIGSALASVLYTGQLMTVPGLPDLITSSCLLWFLFSFNYKILQSTQQKRHHLLSTQINKCVNVFVIFASDLLFFKMWNTIMANVFPSFCRKKY